MPNSGPTLARAWWLLSLAVASLSAAPGEGPQTDASHIIDVWETEDGLPGNSVISMVQTRDGYLWLSTLYGLARFDGVRFTVFDAGNTPGLGSSPIVKLFEDSRGRLWAGGQNGVTVLVEDGRVVSPPELAHGGPERALAGVCEDAGGAVWLLKANGELWRQMHGRLTPFWAGPSAVRAIIREPDGPVWVGTDRRQVAIGGVPPDGSLELPVTESVDLSKLDFLVPGRREGYWRLDNGRIQRWRAGQLASEWFGYPWGNARILSACEDAQGNLVVGTSGAGVFWFDAEGQATRISTQNGLSHDVVLSLCFDREGALWVGTDGSGLNRVKRQVFEVLPESQGIVVQSVGEDDAGTLWIGSNGGGVSAWTNGRLHRLGFQTLTNLPVRSVLVDQRQQVWVGTLGLGLLEVRDGQWLQRAAGADAVPALVNAIHEDRQGRLWVGTQNGLARRDGREWQVFTAHQGLSADVVLAIADDAEGNVWVGTEGGGLNRFRDGRFTAFTRKDGLPSDDISSLCVDGEGVLWVGTRGGLARFHQGRWTRYSTAEGLLSNRLGYLLDDGQGNLWIGSNVGLMRVPRKALNDFAHGRVATVPCRAYGRADGLPAGECTFGSQPGPTRTRAGRLWFPTIKGLVSVDPARLQSNPFPPPVVIESVLVEGQPQNTNALRTGWPQPVVVPAGKQRLEIHYTSLNLGAPERARFKYRLEGHETDWIEAGNTRVARYSKLPPGDYRFQVTACNEDGLWNETGSVLALVVPPPFWRTWWFLTATGVGALGLVVGGVHYVSTQKLQRQVERMRQQEALEQERARIARDLHDQLGASLTQVALLGELVETDKDAPAEVEAHAQQICQTARDTTRVLDEIVWAVNPSNDTLDGLVTYVCKYAQEYLAVAGLKYRLEVPPQLPSTPIPPEVRHNVFLAAKEAVTNVVRHAKASAAWVRLRLEPGRFTFEIADNGRGLAGMDRERAATRNGLRNMQKRMEDVGGAFALEPAPEGGAVVRLSAPLGKGGA